MSSEERQGLERALTTEWSKTQAISCAWNYWAPRASSHETDFAGFNLDVKLTWQSKNTGPGLEASDVKTLLRDYDHSVLNEVFAKDVSENEVLSHSRLAKLMFIRVQTDLPDKGLVLQSLEIVFFDGLRLYVDSNLSVKVAFQDHIRSVFASSADLVGVDLSLRVWLEESDSFRELQAKFEDSKTKLAERLRLETLNSAFEINEPGELGPALFGYYRAESLPVVELETFNLLSGNSTKVRGSDL